MKTLGFAVIILLALTMVVVPAFQSENFTHRQAQEESPATDRGNTFQITYEVQNPDDENIADIIWMKKAAKFAQNQGVPYFNVLRQSISRRFVKKFNQELSIVSGVIELNPDSTAAEFHAAEIEGLVLEESPF